jgi:hypothetical protein
VERQRFDDVGIEILEVPDTSRRRRPRRRFLALGVLAGSAAALVAAAALAATPAQAPQGGAPAAAAPSPVSFSVERYPARHRFTASERGHQHPIECLAGTAHPAGRQ